jgi:hypothetical protein
MITPSFGLTATERVLPKLALDFTNASLDSRITFTRTTSASNPATYVDSSGLIVAATNDQPRFDYDPVTLACKGLLIEESRQNISTYSSDLSGAGWSASAVITLTASALTSPDGTANAYQASITNNTGTVSKTIAIAANTNTYYTTVYYKYISGTANTRLRIALTGGTSVALFIAFNNQTGAFVSSSVGAVYSIQNAGDGWWRVGIAITNNGTNTNLIVQNFITNDTTASKEIGIWGLQVEAGAFATSYIPTEASALIRNADVATMTGTNFSDWYNATEGTFVAKANYANVGTAKVCQIYTASDNTVTNRTHQFFNNNIVGNRCISATSSAVPGNIIATFPASYTCALAYKMGTGNVGAAVNSSPVQSATSTGLPVVDRLYIGARYDGTAEFLNSTIQKLNFYHQRLINAEVQAFSKG